MRNNKPKIRIHNDPWEHYTFIICSKTNLTIHKYKE